MSRRCAQSPCGGSRAAAADADVTVIALNAETGLVLQLRQALRTHLEANRFVLHNFPHREADLPSPRLRGEGREGGEVTVYAIPVTDTCKQVVDGVVRRTVPRDDLVDAQGPWVFSREALATAIQGVVDEARIDSIAELCQRARLRIRVRLA